MESNQFPFETNLNPTPRPRRFGNRIIAAILVLVVVFGGGFALGQHNFQVNSGRLQISKGPDRSADYSLLWDALDILNSKYVDREHLDQKQLLYGSVKGLLDAANDPYTVFFTPDEAQQFAEELKGSFDGIGAEIGIKDDQLVVIAPLPGTPAQRSGLLPGDKILAIDGQVTTGLAIDEAVSKIRGKAGTKVVLTIIHSDKTQAEDVTLTREKIEIKSLTLETKQVDGKKIAVLELVRFGDDTKGLFDHAVDVILSGNYQGIILDMRSNPGGYLDTAVDLASNWVENDQVVVKEVNYENRTKEYKAEGVSRLKGVKTIVLVNAGSASASEILAGSLQDYKLATLVGTKTFGKGSVQELVNTANDSTLKVTIAKWLTPNGRSIDKQGLEPDVVVERTSDDINADRDPQMDKALELLK